MNSSCLFRLRWTCRLLDSALAGWLTVVIGMLTCSVGLAVGPNELVNGSLEKGDTVPQAWTTGSWNSNVQFTWNDHVSFDGMRSIQIQNTSDNDAWWEQVVQLEPNTVYQLSGWIRTEGVSEAGVGANLALNGTWTHTDGLHGTNDWTYKALTFNSGDSGVVTIGARLGYWSNISTGTAWFDALQLNRIDASDPHPSWKIQVIVYDDIDVTLIDEFGVAHHVKSTISLDDVVAASNTTYDFVNTDIPALNSGNMIPTLLPLTIRATPLTTLSPSFPAGRYWPAPEDVAADIDPAADAVIVLWNPHGIDVDTGQEYLINGYAGLTPPMGTGPTYLTAIIDSTTVYPHRNVLKHEFGHSLLSYYESAGVTPTPTVNNHPEVEYVHCGTGTPYVWEDETLASPIPNSIYNNESGFTHDYYSGQTAVIDDPTHCLGITPLAWATGGPISKPYIAPEPPTEPTLSERVLVLQESVRSLVDDNHLAANSAHILLGRLDQVSKVLAKPKCNWVQAQHVMRVFVQDCQRLVKQRKLSASDGQWLIQQAQVILDEISIHLTSPGHDSGGKSLNTKPPSNSMPKSAPGVASLRTPSLPRHVGKGAR